MDDITRQFFVLVRKIRLDIHQALKELKFLHTSEDEHSTGNETQIPEQDLEIIAAIRAIKKAYGTAEAQKYALDHRRYRLERKAYWVATRTLIIVGVYTGLTLIIAYQSKRSADAAQTASDTSAKQLELAQRPWVDARVAISGPLTFDVNGARFRFLITLRNTGNSPAFNTTVNPVLISAFGLRDPFKTRVEVCNDAVKQVNTLGYGISLFPKIDFESPTFVYLSNQDIKAAQDFWHGRLNKQIVDVYLIACVAYRPTFNDKSIYTTGYIFEISKIDGKTGLPNINFIVGESVDADHLRLKLGPGSIVAN